MPPTTFSKKNFKAICDDLAKLDGDLKLILDSHGYPPLWKRPPGFATLVQIILEQQVSLASAKAAYIKLTERLGTITPAAVLSLTREELKACYFSRQKIIYVTHLAQAICSGQLKLRRFPKLSNEEIRQALTQVKGIGKWTADVYLMMAMQRTDLFPLGDIALINSIKAVKRLEPATTREAIATIAERWRPYQTVAAYLLWHSYLSKKSARQKLP
jgi:DNA-3-methyladenine glycosylase II